MYEESNVTSCICHGLGICTLTDPNVCNVCLRSILSLSLYYILLVVAIIIFASPSAEASERPPTVTSFFASSVVL